MIHLPALGQVVDAADEEVPVRQARQLLDPRLAPGDEVALEPEADGELRECGARLLHRIEIARQIGEAHAPVVKLLWHRVVIREADLAEPQFHGVRGVFERPARRVMAERGVDVVVGEHWGK